MLFQKILLEAPKAKALITRLDKSLVENQYARIMVSDYLAFSDNGTNFSR